MSGSGKGVSGMVGISQNEGGAGTFPDKWPQPQVIVTDFGLVTRCDSHRLLCTCFLLSHGLAWVCIYSESWANLITL